MNDPLPEPDWDWDDDEEPLRIHPDLQGQGLTPIDIHTMTDVQLTGGWL
ncbi:hypothetical protein ACJWDR_37675 [Streptomyces tauricus]